MSKNFLKKFIAYLSFFVLILIPFNNVYASGEIVTIDSASEVSFATSLGEPGNGTCQLLNASDDNPVNTPIVPFSIDFNGFTHCNFNMDFAWHTPYVIKYVYSNTGDSSITNSFMTNLITTTPPSVLPTPDLVSPLYVTHVRNFEIEFSSISPCNSSDYVEVIAYSTNNLSGEYYVDMSTPSCNSLISSYIPGMPTGYYNILVQDHTTGSPIFEEDNVYINSGNYDAPTPSTPIVAPLRDITINEEGTYAKNDSFIDPDSNTTSWTGTINYGDGGDTQALTLNGMNFNLSHQYNSPGTYTVTLNISNNLGETGTATATITVNSAQTIVTAINAGGDTEGSFAADTGFSGGSTFSSSSTVDTSGVTNPAPQAVYQSVRFGNFSYTVPNLTPNTNYTLRLHFNEVYFGANGNSGGVGSRVFNVSVNGTTALNNFDIYQAAEGANKAVVEDLPATSDSNGNITVQFSSVVDNAMVNGIEVDSGSPATTPTPTPTPITSEAINAGGTTSGSFLSDIDSTGGSTFSTTASIDTTGVTNPAPESVYQSVRYGNFTYDLTNFAPNSSHTVRLHFSEPYWGTALASGTGGDGSRVFNVSINGTQVLTNFDVYQTAGGADKAVIEEFPVSADSNGKISIQFSTVTDNAMVSGVEVN